MGLGTYYYGAAMIALKDSSPTVATHVSRAAVVKNQLARRAFFIVGKCAGVSIIGLVILTLSILGVLKSEPAIGRLILEGIIFATWFLFYWLVRLLHLLLKKGKNATACVVAVIPVCIIWAFIFTAAAGLSGL